MEVIWYFALTIFALFVTVVLAIVCEPPHTARRFCCRECVQPDFHANAMPATGGYAAPAAVRGQHHTITFDECASPGTSLQSTLASTIQQSSSPSTSCSDSSQPSCSEQDQPQPSTIHYCMQDTRPSAPAIMDFPQDQQPPPPSYKNAISVKAGV